MAQHPIAMLLTHSPWVMDAYAAKVGNLTRERVRQIRDAIHPADRPDTLVTALNQIGPGPFDSVAAVAKAINSRSGYLVHYANAYEMVAVELTRLIPGEDRTSTCTRCGRSVHRWELATLSGSNRTSWCRTCEAARTRQTADVDRRKAHELAQATR